MAEYSRTYTVILRPSEDGWLGYCLELPDCTGKGQGKRAAYQSVKEAIRDYLRQLLLLGASVPRRDTVVKHPRFDLREIGFEVQIIR